MQKVLASLRFLSKIISKIVTAIVLTVVYIFGIGPTAILGRIFGKDFLGEKRRATESYWIPYKEREPSIENFLKPY